jgi:hypothetical protein
MLQKRGVLEIVGSARVDRDEFHELLSTIKETNWPAVRQNIVQNEDCHMPSTVGEDYSGTACTGTVVATRDNNCEVARLEVRRAFAKVVFSNRFTCST